MAWHEMRLVEPFTFAARRPLVMRVSWISSLAHSCAGVNGSTTTHLVGGVPSLLYVGFSFFRLSRC